ncbi:MAG: hypothetical protein ABN479_19770 [Billgrantia sp.]
MMPAKPEVTAVTTPPATAEHRASTRRVLKSHSKGELIKLVERLDRRAQQDHEDFRAAIDYAEDLAITLDLVRQALGVPPEPHQGMPERILEAAKAAAAAAADRGPVAAIAAERVRQVNVEGWTPEHDDQYQHGELILAAGGYAAYAADEASHWAALRRREKGVPPPGWPWSAEWWKPTTRRRDLVKAGALIVAELERLNRAEERAREKSGPAACPACNSQPGQYHAPECPAVDAFTAGRIPAGGESE